MASQPISGLHSPGRLAGAPAEPEEVMTLVEHLEDLRRVILVSLIAWALTTGLAFAFNHQLIQILEHPLTIALSHRHYTPFGNHVIITSPIEGLSIPFKVAAIVGFVGAFPIVAWQIWTFVAPGLTRRERRLFGPFMSGTMVCFLLGAAFAYFVMPIGLSFLITFLGSNAVYLPDLSSYITFFGLVIVIFGLAFEMPVVLCLLGALRIVNAEKLSRWRLKAYFVIVAVSLVITPGADPFTPTFLSIALILLYEIATLIIRVAFRRPLVSA